MKFKPQTYQEIIDLANGVNAAGADKKNAKFSLRIAQTKYALKKHVDFVDAAKEVPPEVEKAEKEKRELFDKYATDITEDGRPKIPNDKWPEFKSELDDLRTKNKKIDDAFEAQMQSYKELLKSQPKDANEKPLIIDLVEIPESMIPGTLTGNQIADIMPIVNLK